MLSDSIAYQKAKAFAKRIVFLGKHLKDEHQEYILSKQIVRSGTIIEAEPSAALISAIFYNKAPLHDGAMIIADERIVAAGAILPVSKNPNIPRHLGLRHRAAMGISEKSDAIVIIVSEETGTISMAIDGAYRLNLTAEDLERNLTELLVTSY